MVLLEQLLLQGEKFVPAQGFQLLNDLFIRLMRRGLLRQLFGKVVIFDTLLFVPIQVQPVLMKLSPGVLVRILEVLLPGVQPQVFQLARNVLLLVDPYLSPVVEPLIQVEGS